MIETPLPTPAELKALFPLPLENRISQYRTIIQNILTQQDPRFLVILGPCSIHDVKAAKEYAKRVKELQEKVKERFFLVMRVHVEKPRTLLGWKGLMHDPFLDGSNDMASGLMMARSLLLDIAKMDVPAAMEFLELMSAPYLSDLISWGAIGARTSSSQPHRQIASGLNMPVGFKNATDGNVKVAIEGVYASQFSHTFMNINDEGKICSVKTTGNPYTHLVLRGGENPNYDEESVDKAMQMLESFNLRQTLLIDCAHGNSSKNYMKQVEVFQSILEQENPRIVGSLLESHLEAGNALSLTDPCIDWSTTESLLLHCLDKAYCLQ